MKTWNFSCRLLAVTILVWGLGAPSWAAKDEENPVILRLSCGRKLAENAGTEIGLRSPDVFYRELFRPDALALGAWFRAKPVRPAVVLSVDLPEWIPNGEEERGFREALARHARKYRSFQPIPKRLAQLLMADLFSTLDVARTVAPAEDEETTRHALRWRILAIEKFETLLLVMGADPGFFSSEEKNRIAQMMHDFTGDLFRFFAIDVTEGPVPVIERGKAYPAWIVTPKAGHPVSEFARKLGTRYRNDPFTLYLSCFEVVHTSGSARGSNESRSVSLGTPIALVPGKSLSEDEAFRRLSEERRLESRVVPFNVHLATKENGARGPRVVTHGSLHDSVASARWLRGDLLGLSHEPASQQRVTFLQLTKGQTEERLFPGLLPLHRQAFTDVLFRVDRHGLTTKTRHIPGESWILYGETGLTDWGIVLDEKKPQVQVSAGTRMVVVPILTGRLGELRGLLRTAAITHPAGAERIAGLVWETMAEVKARLEFAEDVGATLATQRERVSEAMARYIQEFSPENHAALHAAAAQMETFDTLQGTLRGGFAGTEFAIPSPAPEPLHARVPGALLETPETFRHLAEAYVGATKPSTRNSIADRIGLAALARYAARLGWLWRDRSRDNVGYDMMLTDPRTSRRFFVEVKSFGAGQKTLKMTRNEVEFARANGSSWLLATVALEEDGTARLDLHRGTDVGGAPAATEETRSFHRQAFLAAGVPVAL